MITNVRLSSRQLVVSRPLVVREVQKVGTAALAALGNELRGCEELVIVRSTQIGQFEIGKSIKNL